MDQLLYNNVAGTCVRSLQRESLHSGDNYGIITNRNITIILLFLEALQLV